MTRGLKALIPIVFLSAVAVAHAQGPDRRLAVFVTTAPSASQEMAGSVDDVEQAIEGAGIRGRRKHLTLVNSAADAHLIVELRARQSAFGMPLLFGRNYAVFYAVKPGSKITAAQFAAMPRGDGSAGRTGAAAQDAPELLLAASVKGSWKLAGAIVATQVDKLAKTHAKLLLKSAAEAP